MTRSNEVSVVKRENTLPVVTTDGLGSFISPSTDVYETPEAYVLMIDLPGAAKEAINVTIQNEALTVKAKIEPRTSGQATFLVNEIKTATYLRMFNLGEGIDRNSIDAQFDHGVLTMKLFKKAEARPREIQIK